MKRFNLLSIALLMAVVASAQSINETKPLRLGPDGYVHYDHEIRLTAGIIGIAGSILPGLPGTPFSWVGMLILYLWGSGTNAAGDPMSLNTLIIWGVVVVVVSVIDYVVPMYFTKITGGSKYAEKGALIGLVAGIILTPIGMIAGSFLGAFLAELLWAKKTPEESLKAAFGSFLGFMLGTGIKTIAACLIMWQIIVYVA